MCDFIALHSLCISVFLFFPYYLSISLLLSMPPSLYFSLSLLLSNTIVLLSVSFCYISGLPSLLSAVLIFPLGTESRYTHTHTHTHTVHIHTVHLRIYKTKAPTPIKATSGIIKLFVIIIIIIIMALTVLTLQPSLCPSVVSRTK